MKSENLDRLRNEFAARLRASGAARGIRAERKQETCDLYIYDVIGQDFFGEGVSAKSIADELAKAKGCKELNVYINSPGGSVFDGEAIYNQLVRFEAQKTCIVDGLAASAASFIAMAGDRIVMAPSASMMIHRAMGGAFGYSDELRDTADVLDMLSEQIAGIYAKRTGCSLSECLAMMADETWMTAAEAKDKGFCDEVSGGCQCACPECKDGDCEECSCDGCPNCDEGKCPDCPAEEPEQMVHRPVLAALERTQSVVRTARAMKRARFLDRLSQDRNSLSREPARPSPGKSAA